jgi:catechol 2,3-dioxygenase-like lactoylglutathione lyase family enzyme
MEELFREGEAMVFLRTPGAADTVTLRRSDSSDRPGDGGGIGHFGFRLADEEDLDRAVEEVERAGGRLIRRGEHGNGQRHSSTALGRPWAPEAPEATVTRQTPGDCTFSAKRRAHRSL